MCRARRPRRARLPPSLPPAGGKVARPKAVTDEGTDVCVGRDGPGAPVSPQSLPPIGGKVARPKAVTDEGADVYVGRAPKMTSQSRENRLSTSSVVTLYASVTDWVYSSARPEGRS